MKFTYRKLALPERSEYFGTQILKPIIPIGIRAGKEELQYAALIDSGADFCIFDAAIGEYLGLDVHSGICEPFGGIQKAGSAVAYLHDVVIQVGGWDYTTTVGFSYEIASHGFGILDQRGFFEHFAVAFDFKKEEIELKPKK